MFALINFEIIEYIENVSSLRGAFLMIENGKQGGRIVWKIIDLFMVCWFVWACYIDYRQKNEDGTRISWLREKMKWHYTEAKHDDHND